MSETHHSQHDLESYAWELYVTNNSTCRYDCWEDLPQHIQEDYMTMVEVLFRMGTYEEDDWDDED